MGWAGTREGWVGWVGGYKGGGWGGWAGTREGVGGRAGARERAGGVGGMGGRVQGRGWGGWALLQGNSRYGWAWYSFYQNLLQERGVGRVGAATREGEAGEVGGGWERLGGEGGGYKARGGWLDDGCCTGFGWVMVGGLLQGRGGRVFFF